MPRVVLAGSNLAATYALDILLDALPPESILVIAPEGSGGPAWHASLADHARGRGVATITPPDVNAPDVLRTVEAHRPDLLLSVYYPQVFRKLLDALHECTALNFHPSRLPQHRGVAPLIWAIADGDTTTALTVHHIDAKIDTGRIVTQRVLPIHPEDTGSSLHRKMANLVRAATAELLSDFLKRGSVPEGVEQTGDASYHPRNAMALNHLDWTSRGARIRNIVRALAPPLPGAYVKVSGEQVVLARVELADRDLSAGGRTPGSVELVPSRPPLVWAADGPVSIVEYVEAGELRPGEALVASGRLVEGQILT